MLTSLKLRTGTLGLAVKILVMPAGKDMVRSPVIFTRQLPEDGETQTRFNKPPRQIITRVTTKNRPELD